MKNTQWQMNFKAAASVFEENTVTLQKCFVDYETSPDFS